MSKSYIPVALRREVAKRAKNLCEYCKRWEEIDIYTFHIDHIYNEAKGGLTESDNLAFACPNCNTKKSENIAGYLPDLKEPFFLYHPRKDDWDDHFRLRATGQIEFLTNTGRATGALLKMNTKYAVTQRVMLIAGKVLEAD